MNAPTADRPHAHASERSEHRARSVKNQPFDDAPHPVEEADRGAAKRTEAHGDLAPDETRYLTLTAASDVGIDRPHWAWEYRIPIAGVTLIAGREGFGKTAFVGYLGARWTRGENPGDLEGKPGNVIYVGSEDDPATVLVPRLTAVQADLDRFVFLSVCQGGIFSVTADAAALDAKLTEVGNVAAVIIDPLDSHLGSRIDAHKKAEVQRTVATLARLAQKHRCAIVGIAHFNKGETVDVLTRVIGSVGFTTSVRAVLAIGENPDNATERVCALAKANMTDKSQVAAVRFRVEQAFVDHPDGGAPVDTARVRLLGEIEDFDTGLILAIPKGNESSARDEAAGWLQHLLSKGPVRFRDIEQFAAEDGIALSTLKRAAIDLGVETERDQTGRGRPSTWRLPGQPLPRQDGLKHSDRVVSANEAELPLSDQVQEIDGGPKPPDDYLHTLAEDGIPWSESR